MESFEESFEFSSEPRIRVILQMDFMDQRILTFQLFDESNVLEKFQNQY
jgi:hypothetical protein